MKVIELRSIETEGNANVMFIRIEIENLEQTLDCIMKILMDLSWLNYFDQEYLKESYKKRACETVNDIKEKFSKCDESKLTSDAGEYVVSVLAKRALTIEFNYVDIPLSELIGKKISGNPGFDFHSQNSNTDTIIFGEAKYVAKETAHMRALKQVSEFIEAEKDIKDIADLEKFCTTNALQRAVNGNKGFAVAFSAKKTTSDNIIESIQRKEEFKKLLIHEEIIFVAVNL